MPRVFLRVQGAGHMELNESASLFRTVARALDAGRAAEAVHQFMQALAHDTTLKHVDLPPVLAKSLGRKRADALVTAFAEHPCMVCKRGLLLCEECDGKGHIGDRMCEECLGLGAANCSFCAGSGWITYNYVPSGLRAAVVVARSRLALADARGLMADALPEAGQGRASLNRKQLAQSLLRLNRLMGAFNNALGVARHPPETGSAATRMLEKVEAACSKAAEKLERRIRRLLVLLSGAFQAEAARADGPGKQRLAERRAAFYGALAKSADFAGTSLYHPYLAARLRPPREQNKPPTTEGATEADAAGEQNTDGPVNQPPD